ncbi:MAG TPA: hypothetical protein VL522_09060, partial [Bordetella sp.]|nr:hypothetical protein [Bordetella sp.]
AQERLTGLIRSAQEAALNPAPLGKLVRAILDTEQVHTGADLAVLLRPMVHELWKEHVSWHADANTKVTDLTPELPPSLADFAATYLREHPTENARAFFLPFHQLAQRDIEIPDDIALAFSRGILPFETFRDLVAVYVSRLPVHEPEHWHFGFTAAVWNDATYWEHSLAALCSPITMALLDGGAITPETLLDWIGMTARVQSVASGYAPQNDASPTPSEYSHPVALLLADWSIANFYDQPARNAALLRHPEKLRALADNLVPFKHIEYLLSVADSVDARVLENEMDRVAAEYARSDTPNKTPQQRAFFYTHQFRTNMSPEQTRRLDESRRNLVVTPAQLYARIIQGDELGETAEQELGDMSDLRKQAAETRDRLRHLHRAMENLRANIPAGTPHERQCARFADAWQGAITVLDDLLQPPLETRLAKNPKEIADRLRAMGADLAFQITDKEEHQGIPASMLLA